ncbi:hypothetical protein GALMADRAFT_617661 [Galerina marginata CBS 339.88]|uniref:Uncharacterized protein n=1 Tax=Galerina marginata (strain CBS 339.88) TaxID=685588 RepID=A0A067SU25_GALM3|nr:hypothetical protein GALMADRAFT_617661 [Galerina marginata CBS 339.88]
METFADRLQKIINPSVHTLATLAASADDGQPQAPVPPGPPVAAQPAPELPPNARQLRFQQRLNATRNMETAEDRDRAYEECLAASKEIASRESRKTRDARQRIKEIWEIWINEIRPSYKPRLTLPEMWTWAVVAEHMFMFLPDLLVTTPPRKGYATLKGSTLVSWFHILLVLLIENLIDQDGKKKGFAFLADQGRLNKLKDQVVQLTTEHNLSRVQNNKVYFGRTELQCLFSVMLDASRFSGPQRIRVFQTGFASTIILAGTMRTSTLAVASHWLEEHGQFLKMRDFKLYVHGYMDFEIKVHYSHFKGALNTPVADEQIHSYRSVRMGHNAFFDPTVWGVLLWFSRGMFGDRYKTLADLCNDRSAEITFMPEKLDEPAQVLFPTPPPLLIKSSSFLASQFGRSGAFVYPPRAISSQALGQCFAEWCEKAGLPRSTLYAVRRETSNLFALQYGAEIAKDILNHSTTGVFRRHYSKNTDNFDLVALRLGETAGALEKVPGEIQRQQDQKGAFLRTAVEYLVRIKIQKGEEEIKELAAKKDAVEELAPVVEIKEKIASIYQLYVACFTRERLKNPKVPGTRASFKGKL